MIYVASRVRRACMWLRYRDEGVPIISSWIDEAGEGETDDFAELWERIEGEIRQCAALVFYAQGVEDFPFKGALIEAGMAIALGKPVFVCTGDTPLEGITLRPLGSWVRHPGVTVCPTLDDAIRMACGECDV